MQLTRQGLRHMPSMPRYMSISATVRDTDAVSKNNCMADKQNKAKQAPVDWHSAKPFSQIPGPKPLPLIGNLWRFFPFIGTFNGVEGRAQHEMLNKKYGKIVKLSELKIKNNQVLIFDPDDIEELFRNEGTYPLRGGFESLKYFKEYIRPDLFEGEIGMHAGRDKAWQHARTISNPAMLRPRTVNMYVGIADAITMDLVKRIQHLEAADPQGQMPENFEDEIGKWIMESLFAIGLNKRLGALKSDFDKLPDPEVQQYITDTKKLFVLFNVLDGRPSPWKWISTPAWRSFVKITNRVLEYLKKEIDEAIVKMEAEGDKPDFELNILEQMVKKDKKVAFSTVFDIFIAGVDTTSRSASAALYYLAINPKVQDKLRAELRGVLPEKDSPITKETLNNIPYLKAVIKETFRMAPVSIGITRRTPKDLVLSGYQIPKGTTVMSGHMFLSRQEVYFPRANEFIPDRWLRKDSDEFKGQESHSFAFLPFGYGPRTCIGKRLAEMELQIFLARVFRHFSVSWPSNEEMKWKMDMFYGVGSPLKFYMNSLKD